MQQVVQGSQGCASTGEHPDGSSRLGVAELKKPTGPSKPLQDFVEENVGTVQLSLPTFLIFKLLSSSQVRILIINRKEENNLWLGVDHQNGS